jgi:cytochrome c peroxidase
MAQDGDQLVSRQSAPPSLPKDTLPAESDLSAIPAGFTGRPEPPVDNPLTPEKVKLGRRLFFDPILSADGTIACASCHRPEHGFAGPQPIAVGIGGRTGKRNAPSLLNRGFGTRFFWDGRVDSLEKQALLPISNPDELGGDLDSALKRLQADSTYVKDFRQCFGPVATSEWEVINGENLAKAIASFERTLIYGSSRVDRFRGAEYEALSREARQGLWIFESRGGCWKCHRGEAFTDDSFHNTGVGFAKSDRDAGLYYFTGDESDRFKFKTPGLRGIEHTPPYMHDGSVGTLREVVEFYNRGGAQDDPMLDERIRPLDLSADEIEFLVEFLKALSQ